MKYLLVAGCCALAGCGVLTDVQTVLDDPEFQDAVAQVVDSAVEGNIPGAVLGGATVLIGALTGQYGVRKVRAARAAACDRRINTAAATTTTPSTP